MGTQGDREEEAPRRMSLRCPAAARPLRGAGYGVLVLLLIGCAVAFRWGNPGFAPRDRVDDALLQLNERALVRVRTRLEHAPRDPRGNVLLARTSLVRAYLLAAAAYERQARPALPAAGDPEEDYLSWRRTYLASDPQNILSDTLQVVRSALRQNPPDRERGELLSASAFALCFLGRHREEADALREAYHLDPQRAFYARRLARAYAEARQFRRAEAVLREADWDHALQHHATAAPLHREVNGR